MTTDNERHTLDISRRRLLRTVTFAAATGALVAAAATAPAIAGAKFSQATAKYQSTPKGADRCANCSQYESAGTCRVVEGQVAPNGWCNLYARKS
jgi:High potential iron-sulfur protein